MWGLARREPTPLGEQAPHCPQCPQNQRLPRAANRQRLRAPPNKPTEPRRPERPKCQTFRCRLQSPKLIYCATARRLVIPQKKQSELQYVNLLIFVRPAWFQVAFIWHRRFRESLLQVLAGPKADKRALRCSDLSWHLRATGGYTLLSGLLSDW